MTWADILATMSACGETAYNAALREAAATAVAPLEEENARLEADIARIAVERDAAVKALADHLATHETTPRARLGAYLGTPAEKPDERFKAATGVWPEIASTYYQYSQTALNIAYETARIGRGTSPLLTVSTKDKPGTITALARGDAAAAAWLDGYLRSLARLSDVDPDVPVYATLEHEAEVKANQGLLKGTDATDANLAAAQSLFIERCRTIAPRVKAGLWFGAYDKTSIGNILDGHRHPVDWIALDCYATDTNQGETTLTDSCANDLRWIRDHRAYARLGAPTLGLGEFGKDKTHGDASVATYMTDLRAVLAAQRLEFALLFPRDKTDPDGQVVGYNIFAGTTPRAAAAFTASMTDPRSTRARL